MTKPANKLQELVTRLQQACGENLASVVVYGSAAREDFHEKFSDVNVLVVLQQLQPSSFASLSKVLHWWSRDEKLRPPMIMTLEELRESADVFAIELLDIKHSHQTMFGADVIAGIQVPMNLHRVEVEHELRTTLMRLRHHLLLSPDNNEELRAVLAKSISSVLTLFRHALIAAGKDAPQEKTQVISLVSEAFAVDGKPLGAILELRNDASQPGDLRELYHAYMVGIQKVIHELDKRAPKRHLQKTS
jgi:predicted nucleotidyltransferase